MHDHDPQQNINPDVMTPAEIEMIRALKHRGFAVIIWAPSELGGADPHRVEDRSCELGHQIIEDLKD